MIHAKVEVQVDAASVSKLAREVERAPVGEATAMDGGGSRQQWRWQRRWTREVERTTMDHTAAVAAALDAGGDNTRMDLSKR